MEGVLSSDEKQGLNAAITKINHDYAVQIALVILPGMDTSKYGSDREFANLLFRHWGIGSKETNRGLLLLLFTQPEQRTIVFEVGYGLEGELPDALCKLIQVNKMVPLMKDGDYAAGLEAGLWAVAEVLSKNSELIDLYKSEQQEEKWGKRFMIFLIWLAVFFFYRSSTIKLVKHTISDVPSYLDLVKLRASPFRIWPTLLWLLTVYGIARLEVSPRWSLFYGICFSLLPLACMMIWFGLIQVRTRKRCFCQSCGRPGTTKHLSSQPTTKPTNNSKGFKTHTFVCTACGYRHRLETPITSKNKRRWGKGYHDAVVDYESTRDLLSSSENSCDSGGDWGGGSSGGGGASTRF